MKQKEEIIQEFKAFHYDLTRRYYENHEMSKAEFDFEHGQIWDTLAAELEAYFPTPDPPESFQDEVKRRLRALETPGL